MPDKKPLNIQIRKINKTSIYRQFLPGDVLTKQELAGRLQLCIPTVVKNIDTLKEEGLIRQSGFKGNTGGRNAVAYALVPDARVALGVELTNDHVTIAALDLLGNIIASDRYQAAFCDTQAYYRALGEAVEGLVRRAGLKEGQILGAGIGLPVLVDGDRKSIVFNKIIDLKGDVHEKLSRHIPCQISLFNDANAAAYTEIWKNPELKNAFYLMLSDNIGGCFVLNRTVYTGATQKSGEVGHMTLVPGGKRCYCGQAGCVETYLAAGNLSALTDGDLQRFFGELEQGDRRLAEAWDSYLHYLALTVNTVHALLDCDIVLGGYVGGYLERYMADLRSRVEKLDSFGNRADYLRSCSCKKEAIASGAALDLIAAFNGSV